MLLLPKLPVVDSHCHVNKSRGKKNNLHCSVSIHKAFSKRSMFLWPVWGWLLGGGCIIALDMGTAMSQSRPLASRVGCKSKLLCKSAETDIFLREVLTDCPCGGDAKIPQNGIALNGFKR